MQPVSLSALAVGLRLCDSAARGIKVNEVHPLPFHSEMKEASLSGRSLCVAQSRASACTPTPENGRTSLLFIFVEPGVGFTSQSGVCTS